MYRVYVTDTLKVISENTAKINGGMTMTKRFIDMLDRTPVMTEEEAEEKSQEIVSNLMDKLRKV